MAFPRAFPFPFSNRGPAATGTGNPSITYIDGRPYLIDTESENYGFTTIDVVQQRNNTDERDLLNLPQDIWRQQARSWNLGAGQAQLDREDSLPGRFLDSYGVDPWERWQLTLLPRTELLESLTSAKAFLQIHGDYLVVCQGNSLTWYNGLDDPSPDVLAVGSGNPIIDATYDGDAVITLHADGKVYKSTNPTTTSLFTTEANSTCIEYVKGYLITGTANKIRDITDGTGADVGTALMTGTRFVGAAEGPAAIYVAGGAGDRWSVYRISVKEDGTGLNPQIVAATLPDGERAVSIGAYLGFVFVGTSKGVRMAVPDASGNLTLGALLPTLEPVYCFEGQDRFVWYGQSSIDATYSATGSEGVLFPSGVVCGLGRMDLSVFTVTAATPAYANDLVAESESGKIVRSVVTYQDKRVFAVENGGVYFQSDELMPAGWIEQGAMSFTLEDLKTATYMQANWHPLHGKVGLDLAYDLTGYTRIQTFTKQLLRSSGNVDLHGTQFRVVAPRLVLFRDVDDSTLGPTITRWELRAVPVKGIAWRWSLPVQIRRQFEVAGVPQNRVVAAERRRLRRLVESGRMVALQESGETYWVTPKGGTWLPGDLEQNGKAREGVFLLVLQEVL